MSPLKHSKSLAARMGRWSANHWKTAVVRLARLRRRVRLPGHPARHDVHRPSATPTSASPAPRISMIERGRLHRRRERREHRGAGRDGAPAVEDPDGRRDPAFRAAIADALRTRSVPSPRRTKVRVAARRPATPAWSPKDGHSAMVQFTPKGTYEEAILYIDIDRRRPSTRSRPVIRASRSTRSASRRDKAIDAEIKGGLAKAGLISIPLTIIILMVVLGLAGRGARSRCSSASPRSCRHDRPPRALEPGRPREREHHGGRPARSASPSASTTRSSTCGANARSGQPAAARALLSRQPPPPPVAPSSSPGMTVLIAMAGMFLSGDKSFMSFSVGTMIVVAVAMLGSLTVLPALLSKLGDRVEKGRIPFVRPSPQAGARAASGARSSTASCGVRSSRPSPAGAVLVALALPALSLHTATDRHRGLLEPGRSSRSSRLADGLPGHAGPGRPRDRGRRRHDAGGPQRPSPSSSRRRSRPAR